MSAIAKLNAIFIKQVFQTWYTWTVYNLYISSHGRAWERNSYTIQCQRFLKFETHKIFTIVVNTLRRMWEHPRPLLVKCQGDCFTLFVEEKSEDKAWCCKIDDC